MTPLQAVRLADDEIPASIDQAYDLVLDAIGTDPAYGAAWKLGGTTMATRRAFGVDRLYFGPLHESEVLTQAGVVPGRKLFELKGEAEIALRISPNAARLLGEGASALSAAPTADLFDAWCVALELPSSPILDLGTAGVKALLADRCASGALALGPEHVFDATVDWTGDSLRVDQDGQTIATGGVAALVASPDACARDFLADAVARGFAPKPGQWISTGGLTPCVPLKPGAAITVYHKDVAALSFTAGFDAS